MQSLWLLAGAAAAYRVFVVVSGLRRNIALAKSTGLPYIVSPLSPIYMPWQLMHKLLIPIVRLLPEPWWEEWLYLISPDFMYRNGHEPFARHGETFLVVSPLLLYLLTASPEVIHQITMRREHFPKYVESYGILRQFGENVLTSEGAVWRMHRKVTAASFNERNAALVFREAIRQTQGMLKVWTGEDGQRSETLHSLEHDTMRLTLNIIGYVGFGLRLLWPGESMPDGTDPNQAKYGALNASAGHKLSFVDAMGTLLDNILILLLVPRWILNLMPFKAATVAVDSHKDYLKYMDELLDDKISQARTGGLPEEGMDLMGQLVRASYGSGIENGSGAAGSGSKAAKTTTLGREGILGNAFIMLVAGHETTANAMHFTMLELATNPASQRRLQKDIDELVGDSDPSSWDYDSLVNPMLASMLGACMNETLRKLPPVVEIPKKVSAHQDQTIVADGRKHVLPRGTVVSLAAVSAHRNPRYWPARPSRIRPGQDDMVDYVPERWFRSSDESRGAGGGEEAGDAGEDFGGFTGPDTSAQLFRPPRGAYMPFSDGPRSCLGRRIAQVEVIAALAVLFRAYSVELAVDAWATDDEVRAMGRDKQAELYRTAQDRSREVIRGATSRLTLKLNGEQHVPVRVVPRGRERFVSWVGEGEV